MSKSFKVFPHNLSCRAIHALSENVSLYAYGFMCSEKKSVGDRTEYGRGQGVRCMLCLVSLAPVLVSFHGNSLV